MNSKMRCKFSTLQSFRRGKTKTIKTAFKSFGRSFFSIKNHQRRFFLFFFKNEIKCCFCDDRSYLCFRTRRHLALVFALACISNFLTGLIRRAAALIERMRSFLKVFNETFILPCQRNVKLLQ